MDKRPYDWGLIVVIIGTFLILATIGLSVYSTDKRFENVLVGLAKQEKARAAEAKTQQDSLERSTYCLSQLALSLVDTSRRDLVNKECPELFISPTTTTTVGTTTTVTSPAVTSTTAKRKTPTIVRSSPTTTSKPATTATTQPQPTTTSTSPPTTKPCRVKNPLDDCLL